MTIRTVTLSLDDASLLALYAEAVVRHTETLTDDDHALLVSVVERVRKVIRDAEYGEDMK